MIKFKVAERTETGVRASNQDYASVFKNKFGFLFAVVADGMGGHVGGQVASKFTVKTIKEFFKKTDFNKMSDTEIQANLLKSVQYISQEFKSIAVKKPELTDMGTTLNFNVFIKDFIYTVNVGDSRSSHLTSSGITQISEDHNLAQLAKVDKRFAKFSKDSNLLTSSLGPTKETKVDIFKTPLSQLGHIIVTSDGVHQHVSEDFLVKTINNKNETLGNKADAIMNEAVRNKTNDNMTLILVRYEI